MHFHIRALGVLLHDIWAMSLRLPLPLEEHQAWLERCQELYREFWVTHYKLRGLHAGHVLNYWVTRHYWGSHNVHAEQNRVNQLLADMMKLGDEME